MSHEGQPQVHLEGQPQMTPEGRPLISFEGKPQKKYELQPQKPYDPIIPLSSNNPDSILFYGGGSDRLYSHEMGKAGKFYGKDFVDDRNGDTYSSTMSQGPRGRPAPYNKSLTTMYSKVKVSRNEEENMDHYMDQNMDQNAYQNIGQHMYQNRYQNRYQSMDQIAGQNRNQNMDQDMDENMDESK